MLKDIHDPKDPNKCCLRGPRFIQDKQLKERINQYNLKHPNDKGATELTKEEKDKQAERLPLPCTLPTATMNNIQVQDKENTGEKKRVTFLEDIDEKLYDAQLPDFNIDNQSSLPDPQHKTLHFVNVPAKCEETSSLTLNATEVEYDNDWDLQQLEAYQDIVA